MFTGQEASHYRADSGPLSKRAMRLLVAFIICILNNCAQNKNMGKETVSESWNSYLFRQGCRACSRLTAEDPHKGHQGHRIKEKKNRLELINLRMF